MCQSCKLACHKKCYARVTTECSGSSSSRHNHSSSAGSNASSATISAVSVSSSGVEAGGGGALFGVTLDKLLAGSSARLPPIIERLITTIELVGLYTEGLYRKSGVSSRVSQLKKLLEEEASNSRLGASSCGVDLQEQPVHVLTAVLKSFLRELPQPLLTYERYIHFSNF